jgi:ABC-type nickel/cobalt efflux system permease component RcnA
MENIKMNEITIKEIEEIHEYLLNKDNMRFGQRIKTNFTQLDHKIDAYQLNMLNRLSDIQDSLEKDTLTIGQFLIVLGIVLGVFSGLLAWILLT